MAILDAGTKDTAEPAESCDMNAAPSNTGMFSCFDITHIDIYTLDFYWADLVINSGVFRIGICGMAHNSSYCVVVANAGGCARANRMGIGYHGQTYKWKCP